MQTVTQRQALEAYRSIVGNRGQHKELAATHNGGREHVGACLKRALSVYNGGHRPINWTRMLPGGVTIGQVIEAALRARDNREGDGWVVVDDDDNRMEWSEDKSHAIRI